MTDKPPDIQALEEKFGGLLHGYQLECVAALDAFAGAIPSAGARAAFAARASEWPYRPAPHMPETPNVCVKVPTGGGKTLIAAASIGPLFSRMPRIFNRSEAPAVLWFAPTGAIVEQTLRALRDPDNRCRKALDLWFPDLNVNPIPLKEAFMLSPSDWGNQVNIVLSTIQSARIGDTDGRKIYDSAGLTRHMRDLPEDVLAKLQEADGRVVRSLANVFRALNPLVIVDEADEARSELSCASIARFSPSWVLEITATPRPAAKDGYAASNVLHQVSAAELREKDMIKWPLRIRALDDWRAIVREAVEKRAALESSAKGALRPVALFHAESKSGQVTAEVLRRMLVEELKIPEDQITRATGGSQAPDASAGTDKSPVRFVITVRQLARGWDCPAAYVLCSVANLQAQGAVEQLLGRVLRLPGARRWGGALDAAYVFAARTDFTQAARAIVDMLKERHGFKHDEAERMTRGGELFDAKVAEPPSPHAPLRIPRLMVRINGGEELFDQSHFFLGEPWKAADLNASLPDFSPEIKAKGGTVDMNQAGKIMWGPGRTTRTRTALFAGDREWTMPSLIKWLVRRIPHNDIPPFQMAPFICGALKGVKRKHGMDDAELAANRFRLERAIAGRLRDHRSTRRARGFQQCLKGMPGKMRLETNTTEALEISESNYRPHELCKDDELCKGIEFKRHLFPEKVGKLDTKEEVACAVYIDSLMEECDGVWLRNLSGDYAHSFWLQIPRGLFYPDFVARLKDGRHLAVEYKGKRDWETPETRDKDTIGRVWAELSDGQCVFVMVCIQIGRGLEEIDDAISGKGE